MIAEDKAAARCHRHTLLDSIGTCAVCGLAGCGTCLVHEAGGYRCQECIRKRRPIVQPAAVVEPLPAPAPPHPDPLMPDTAAPLPPPERTAPPPPNLSLGRYFPKDGKFFVSLLVFLAGVMIPLLVTFPTGTPALGDRMQVGYAFWAVFWGAPTAWRLGRKLVFWLASFGCPGIGLGLGLAWIAGWFYCLFGGGIYQFFKHWWAVTRRPALQR